MHVNRAVLRFDINEYQPIKKNQILFTISNGTAHLFTPLITPFIYVKTLNVKRLNFESRSCSTRKIF